MNMHVFELGANPTGYVGCAPDFSLIRQEDFDTEAVALVAYAHESNRIAQQAAEAAKNNERAGVEAVKELGHLAVS